MAGQGTFGSNVVEHIENVHVKPATIGDSFYALRLGNVTLLNLWGFGDLGKGLWTIIQSGFHREQGHSCKVGRFHKMLGGVKSSVLV